ncbi:MAG TPA: hypothetical protein PJ988_22415 [Anaerolinea sp.]|nr:hypothetical protein [Anaerolinea sp.]
MERSLFNSICSQVYRQFPETKGAQPKVTARPDEQYLLIFKAAVTTGDGRSLPRTIRVVADARGKIVKMTTSH